MSSADALLDATSPSNLVYDPTSPASIQTRVSAISSAESDFKQKWAERTEAIENILVK